MPHWIGPLTQWEKIVEETCSVWYRLRDSLTWARSLPDRRENSADGWVSANLADLFLSQDKQVLHLECDFEGELLWIPMHHLISTSSHYQDFPSSYLPTTFLQQPQAKDDSAVGPHSPKSPKRVRWKVHWRQLAEARNCEWIQEIILRVLTERFQVLKRDAIKWCKKAERRALKSLLRGSSVGHDSLMKLSHAIVMVTSFIMIWMTLKHTTHKTYLMFNKVKHDGERKAICLLDKHVLRMNLWYCSEVETLLNNLSWISLMTSVSPLVYSDLWNLCCCLVKKGWKRREKTW